MVWNLWNVVRHYAYIKYFKNQNRILGSDPSSWNELERQTKRIVKGIYRTFQTKKHDTFGNVDGSSSNDGVECMVNWTNSFVEITDILERNAREHEASLVMFTGNVDSADSYLAVKGSESNFRIDTLDGMDASMGSDGIDPSITNIKRYGDMPISYILGDNYNCM